MYGIILRAKFKGIYRDYMMPKWILYKRAMKSLTTDFRQRSGPLIPLKSKVTEFYDFSFTRKVLPLQNRQSNQVHFGPFTSLPLHPKIGDKSNFLKDYHKTGGSAYRA